MNHLLFSKGTNVFCSLETYLEKLHGNDKAQSSGSSTARLKFSDLVISLILCTETYGVVLQGV